MSNFNESMSMHINMKSYLRAKCEHQQKQIELLKANKDHLQWFYNRMIHVYGENPHLDYMLKFKDILEGMNDE